MLQHHIPRSIKINVLRRWLHGESREEIAREEGISTGTVSKIIKEYRHNDDGFDLLRQLALILRSEGYSTGSFACLVRIREILTRLLLLLLLLTDTTTTAATRGGEQEGNKNNINNSNNHQKQQQELVVEEEEIESLVVALEVFCFKQKLPIKDFVELVYDLYRVANSLDVSLENLPGYVKQLENTIQTLIEEIQEKRLEKQEALEHYDVTLELLEEYDAERPLFEENKKLREELADARQERDFYKRQIESERANDLVDDYNTSWFGE
jgi:transcriptional regulator with XRE-family HTH domain